MMLVYFIDMLRLNMLKNKLLIITSLLSKDLTRLHGLVNKQEVNNEILSEKIVSFYENKKELINSFNKYEKLYKCFKELKDKYKDDIIFVNQEIDNKFKIYDIEHLNLQGNLYEYYCEPCNLINNTNICSKCNKENLFYNITLKEDKRQYSKVVDLINIAQNLIFIGNISELDPTLYTEDFIDSLYISEDEVKYNGQNPYLDKEERNKNFSDFFTKKIITTDLNLTIEDINNFVKNKLNKKMTIDINNPFKNKGEEIINIINDYFEHLKSKHNIKNMHYDRRIVNSLKKTYPFTKKLPELYLHNIWFAYCYDTKRNPSIVKYDYLFYDMLLVYSKFRWEGVKKYFTKHPKVSLTIAYNENDEKSITLFKKLLFKNEDTMKL